MKLFERLGVPDNLENVASEIYDTIIHKLKNIEIRIPNIRENRGDLIELGRFDFTLGDVEFKGISFNLELVYNESVEKSELIKLSHNVSGTSAELWKDTIKINPGENSLSATIIIGDGATRESIISASSGIKKNLIAHELGHLYNKYKKGHTTMAEQSEYESYALGRLPEKLQKLTALLYYFSEAELVVRPSELYVELIDKGVTRGDFIKFIESSEMMRVVNDGINFNYEEFKSELDSDPEVEIFIKEAEKALNWKREEGNVVKLLMTSISAKALSSINKFINYYIHHGSTNIIDRLVNGLIRSRQAGELFTKSLDKYQKWNKNPDKYFKMMEKRINYNASKVKRKLYKLYDLLPESESAIKNWDLHTKISSKNEKNIIKNWRQFWN